MSIISEGKLELIINKLFFNFYYFESNVIITQNSLYLLLLSCKILKKCSIFSLYKATSILRWWFAYIINIDKLIEGIFTYMHIRKIIWSLNTELRIALPVHFRKAQCPNNFITGFLIEIIDKYFVLPL